jgi:hypothetical protein
MTPVDGDGRVVVIGDRVRILNGVEKGRTGEIRDLGDNHARVAKIYDARNFDTVWIETADLRKESGVTENEKKQIVVTVEEGTVTSVNGIPDDYVVIVHDYDIDGMSPEETEKLAADEGGKHLEFVFQGGG